MKKIFYMLGIALLTASCTEDYTDWASPQVFPEEEAKTVTVTTAAAADVDFATAEGDMVQLFVPTVTASDENTTTYKVTLWNEDKSASEVITANNDGYAAKADLQTAVERLFGKRPVMRTIAMDIEAYTMVNGQSIKSTSTGTINVTLTAPYISTTYYLIGAPSEWLPTCTTLPFTHSGKDVYEDPVFTVMFPVTDGEVWFAIADDKTVESNDWSMVFGCAEGNGNNGTEGKLARRNELTDDGSWKVVVEGDAKFVKMTINMMDCTYKLEKMNFAEWAWLPGDQNGWSHGAAGRIQSANFDGVYTGYAYLNGVFKMTSQADWNGTNYGWATETTLSTDGGAGNLWAEAGFYAVTGDFAALTWTLTPQSWGIIGSASPGGWDSDTDMTYDTTKKCLTATVNLVAGEIKFRANDDWGVNFGGDINNLGRDGSNIAIAEAGTYTIDLYLERVSSDNFYCTITKN